MTSIQERRRTHCPAIVATPTQNPGNGPGESSWSPVTRTVQTSSAHAAIGAAGTPLTEMGQRKWSPFDAVVTGPT